MSSADITGRLPAHIEARIDKTSSPDGCWLWTGPPNTSGYGQVMYQTKVWRTHRLVYTVLVGPIPDGLEMDHVRARGCRSTMCCNPEHLEPVTHRENMLRGDTFGAHNATKTHCLNGHEFTPENTYRYGTKRKCRACKRATDRAAYVPRGIYNGAKTHCDSGHELTPENTYLTAEGWRKCRTCRTAYRRAYKARKAQEKGSR